MPCAFLIGLVPTTPSQFEVGSSFATISDPVSEATTFFTYFDQPEINDLSLAKFWGFGPPFLDFHGFRVLEDCVFHLAMIYNSHGDFMRGFRLGHFAKEHFLRMLGSMMNDIEHNFVDTVSIERILHWRAAIQELIIMKRVQPAVDVIDARIEILKKEVADLEGLCECLLSSINGPSSFGDQTLISRLL